MCAHKLKVKFFGHPRRKLANDDLLMRERGEIGGTSKLPSKLGINRANKTDAAGC
jgi:hypothetical protein